MKTAIIGGGAAGFFLAVSLKEMDTAMDVTVFEKSSNVLSKVLISGGGRCNCTNSFENITDLQQVYPRGYRLMKNLFNVFSPEDAYKWFESHGVKLKTQDDGRVFPLSGDSRSIVNMFLYYAEKYGVKIKTNSPVTSLDQLKDFDFTVLTSGGGSAESLLSGYNEKICVIKPSIPSLFGFKTDDDKLKQLMGLSIDNVAMMIPQTKLRSSGSVVITHMGVSGPCVLKLSSYAAELLKERNYRSVMLVNWVNMRDQDVKKRLEDSVTAAENKIITNYNPFSLPQRFWEYILQKTMPNRTDIRYKDLTQKEKNRLTNTLCNDTLQITGKATNKEEFVTCGGIALQSLNASAMQLKNTANIFAAGEVLDIDGITGGFNFQAAWSTAYAAARGICNASKLL